MATKTDILVPKRTFKIGEVYYIDFPEGGFGIQAGLRPGIIVSNDIGNLHSPLVNVIPLTTSHGKFAKHLPMHVHIPANGSLRSSIALVEQMRPVPKENIQSQRIWVADDETIRRIAIAMHLQYPFCSIKSS
ncbi:MAG: type II toxin-antitoxin system PemK/MazF family toxin [Clostridia bacterium]|nr:type II toxin-antitoxin system PemK/MazF family toxin [Clostridia bacterium]